MLPIILLILGILYLQKKNYATVITLIVVLASTYLQLPFRAGDVFFRPSSYNVSDIGIVLYILFFIKISRTYGVKYRGKLQTPVNIFYLFIIINGIYDIILGTSISDVIKYCRGWIFLTIIYIYEFVPFEHSLKSFKQVYYLTLIICAIVTYINLEGIDTSIFRIVRGRGVKPSSFSMLYSVAAMVNFFQMKKRWSYLHAFIFFLPIVLNMKMTYAGTCVLMFFIYHILDPGRTLVHKVPVFMGTILAGSLFLFLNTSFQERLSFTLGQVENVRNQAEEDDANFSYRILHAQERYQYISHDIITYIRGIGYIQERNLNKKLFNIGTYNKDEGTVAQLDTGDIAWSLFFVRLGMLGLLLYLMMYFSIIRKYWEHRRVSQYTNFFIAYMLSCILFCSLGNTIVAQSDFFIYPFLFLKLLR